MPDHPVPPAAGAPPRPPISVLLVDDHPLLIQGLVALLAGQPGISVVGQASDGRCAVEQARRLKPAVIVMDFIMPEMDGVRATREILGTCHETRIIGLTTTGGGRTVREALDAGMHAYLPKIAAADELVTAIRAVAAGETYVSPRAGAVEPKPDVLTPREQEVLRLLASGKSAKEIAVDLDVSIKTIETHRVSLKQKLNLYTVAELTKYAIREGMTSLE
jgi:DNA-binding NarL/FixJ family response regulator